MTGVRALPFLLLACLLTACAATPSFTEDGWGVQRRLDGRVPALLSISEINAGTPAATGGIDALPIRTRAHGRYRIALAAERTLVPQWAPGAALFDPDIDRALEWLALLGANEPRGVEVRLTLMPDRGARAHQQLHPAGDTLVLDLLVPVAAKPRSRSTLVEAALATGLHEAAHALRQMRPDDRDGDEYHSSLVAACFRIEGLQRGDRIDLGAQGNTAGRDFVRAHSAEAGLQVRRDLATALGKQVVDGGDPGDLRKLHATCAQRLGSRR